MPCPLAGLRALTVLAASIALVAPSAVARPAPEPPDEPSGFQAEGEWTRFRAFDGRECIPGDGSGTFSALVAPVSDREIRVDFQATGTCSSLNYQRTFGGRFLLQGQPRKGYEWEERAWCTFLRVSPLPDSADDEWRVEAGEFNPILGGCEVMEGVGRLAGGGLASDLLGDATTRP